MVHRWFVGRPVAALVLASGFSAAVTPGALAQHEGLERRSGGGDLRELATRIGGPVTMLNARKTRDLSRPPLLVNPIDCARNSDYTAFPWESPLGTPVTAQAGFVQGGVQAVSYQLQPSDFPLRINQIQTLLAGQTSVTTTTKWTVLVWDGLPGDGTTTNPPVAQFSSDGELLPHLVAQPGAVAGIITFAIDPQDPDQIIIGNTSGTGILTIGFRIDALHSPYAPPLNCMLGGGPTNANIFPATDTDGLSQAGNNWIRSIDCGATGCIPGGGWRRFSQLATNCRPSGDWLMRVNWQPINCNPPVVGACCFGNACATLSPSDCLTANGSFQGAGTVCGPGNTCPTGACCLPNGSCVTLTSADCLVVGGTFRGAGTSCATANCPQPVGACCLTGGGCIVVTQSNCTPIPGASWAGAGTGCASCAACYVNCDGSTTSPVLSPADFVCFLNKYRTGEIYANCDGSTTVPVLSPADFVCFLNKYRAGC